MSWITGCIIFIVCIICAGVCAEILHSKGRSTFGGCLLGFFLGIIGVIIAACLPKDEEQIRIDKIKSGLYKQCPICREVIDIHAVLCPYCKSEQTRQLPINPKNN